MVRGCLALLHMTQKPFPRSRLGSEQQRQHHGPSHLGVHLQAEQAGGAADPGAAPADDPVQVRPHLPATQVAGARAGRLRVPAQGNR